MKVVVAQALVREFIQVRRLDRPSIGTQVSVADVASRTIIRIFGGPFGAANQFVAADNPVAAASWPLLYFYFFFGFSTEIASASV